MVCPRCAAINRVDARFCRACAAPLSRTAPAAPAELLAEPAGPPAPPDSSGREADGQPAERDATAEALVLPTAEPADGPAPAEVAARTAEPVMQTAAESAGPLATPAAMGAALPDGDAPAEPDATPVATPPAVDAGLPGGEPRAEPEAAPALETPSVAETALPGGDPPVAPEAVPLVADAEGQAAAAAGPGDALSVPPDAPTTPLEAFGVPDAPVLPPPPFAPDTAAAAPPAGPPAGALGADAEAGVPRAERVTGHLDSDEVPAPAPPVPGEAFPALQPGAVVAGRYQITEVLQTGPQRQSYLALDQQGYLRCWACGSRDNVQGELYCTNCGAQLTGRTYRLLETPPDAPVLELPAPLAENQVPGLGLVYDMPTDSHTGRHYLVLEDVGGRSLSAWAAAEAASGTAVPDDRLVSVLSQAAQRLQDLHAAGIVGCDFTPQALHVLADDRLVLTDPSACRAGGTMGDGRGPGAEAQADVQRVAAALEQWYAELRPGEAPPAAGETGTVAGVLARGREGAYPSAAQFAGAVKDLLSLTVAPRDLQLVSGRASDVGVQRQLNEDSLFALECVAMEAAGSTPIGIYIVADGMGGHDSGEVASSIAIRTIAGKLTAVVDGRLSGEQQDVDPEARRALVRSAILEANGRISRLSQERGSDMGTTVTMAVVLGNQATVANVGDSRTYLWRDGKLQQITQDHSLVARLVAAGQITPDEGRHYDRRNEIYRALGDARLHADEIDVFQIALRPLDALLLCSDGLWEMVRDAEIEQIMLDAPDPVAAAQTLIDVANHNGGEDNISVIIAQTLTSLND